MLIRQKKKLNKLGVKNMKRIGILTGGGDCPGLNPVIRAVVKLQLKSMV